MSAFQNITSNKANTIKYGIVGIVFIGIIGGYSYHIMSKAPNTPPAPIQPSPKSSDSVSQTGLGFGAISAAKDQLLNDYKELNKTQTNNTNELQMLKEQVAQLQRDNKTIFEDAKKTIDSLLDNQKRAPSDDALEDISYIPPKNKPNVGAQGQIAGKPSVPTSDPFSQGQQGQNVAPNTEIPRTISQTVVANLQKNDGDLDIDLRDVKKYLPAGAFASAVVLIGADASVGVTQQAEPLHVQFRVTSPAVSAIGKDGKTQVTDIEGCIITGQAKGELSSEKVYVRLQTITCSPKDGYVIEVPVQGGAAGRGKTGVRGPVISREGNLITQAFFAELLGGIGKAAASALQPNAQGLSISGGNLTTTNNQTIGQKLESQGIAGIGTGLGNATTRIADYLIRKAEQYQPVVELSAGREVELVFYPRGTFIDGRKITEQAQAATLPNTNLKVNTPQGGVQFNLNQPTK